MQPVYMADCLLLLDQTQLKDFFTERGAVDYSSLEY